LREEGGKRTPSPKERVFLPLVVSRGKEDENVSMVRKMPSKYVRTFIPHPPLPAGERDGVRGESFIITAFNAFVL